MTATARGGLPRPHARAGYAAPLLPAPLARLAAFAPLVAFCSLMWARTLDPAASARMLAASGVAIAAAAALLRVRGPWRYGVGVAAAAGALLVAGVPARMLLPGGWDELLAGLGAGFGDLPTTNVPYRGRDGWTIVVLLLIGGLLAVLAAWLAFAPRRSGELRGPVPAVVALGVLFTVPAVQVEGGHPWIEGIPLAILLCAFLRLERIDRHGARAAVTLVVVAGLAAAVAAPRLDVGKPLVDPEAIANAFAPARGLQFSWSHTYGPLMWPRTGREVLRIKAPVASYWKVENLSRFDGLRWEEPSGTATSPPEASTRASQRDWQSDIHVRVRGFSTRLFVGAGTTLAISASPRLPIPNAPGTFRTGPRPLHPGQSYDAVVWNPRPSPRDLRAGRGELPSWTWQYLRIDLPPALGGPTLEPADGGVLRAPSVAQVWFPAYSVHTPPFIRSQKAEEPPRLVDGMLRRSAYGGVYRLAEALRSGTRSPYDYVERVMSHLARGYAYDETPPPSRVPLASFLLQDKRGYCQQFSGAMALLLRMGGVPARVATGFSPGTLDRTTGEYVVRDTDAHSWVEAYIAPFGWITLDPTPPVGLARLGTNPSAAASGYALGVPPGVLAAGERVGDRNPGGGPAGGGGSPIGWILAGVGGAVVVLAAGLVLWHRRRGAAPPDAAVAELCAALEGTGRTSTGGLTLQTMLRRYRGTPAEPYLRTLQAARFAGADTAPTPAMRAALRRELALGLGPAARLGAWRAIPPVVARRSRSRSTYPGLG